jgi:hypothetical protein
VTLAIVAGVGWAVLAVLSVVATVMVRVGNARWRNRVGFHLPRRQPGSREPSRTVRVYLPPWEGGRWGSLTTGSGRVQLDTLLRGRLLLRHTQGPVIAVYARLLPIPGRRRGFVLRGTNVWCGIYGSAFTMRLIREEVEAAGFPVVDETRRFAKFPIAPAAYLTLRTDSAAVGATTQIAPSDR